LDGEVASVREERVIATLTLAVSALRRHRLLSIFTCVFLQPLAQGRILVRITKRIQSRSDDRIV
jgi:hypothetical protein